MQPVADSGSSTVKDEIRVLLLAENERDARLLKRRVEASGPRVHSERVDDADAMKQALLAADWDLVLSTHDLSGLRAREALAILKATGRNIPFAVYPASDVNPAVPANLPALDKTLVQSGHSSKRRKARNAGSPVRKGSPARGKLASAPMAPLGTRSRFLQLAPRALAACGVAEQAVLCFIDFSNFGVVNTAFGYATGDAVLQQIAARLTDYANVGFAAHFGGDEFVVLQAGFDDEDAIHRYVQDLSSVVTQCYNTGELKLHLASDIGVSVYPEGGKSLSELVLNAETALHQCKRLMGRDAYIFYFPELNPARGENILLESALSQALERNELRLYYQPCVSLSDGRVTSVEALVRWQHPELGLLASERFVPLATECGFIGEIDSWVLREASRQASAWRAQGHALTIAINVSASEFAHPRLLGRAAMALQELGPETNALEIEITESALVHDTAASIRTLQALRNMGVRIAIDDFGTGYSSLAYLKRFPVDILKIDKSFVKNIAADPADAAIAQTIVALARNLGLTAQAEGVETREQLEILGGYGCDRAQGHYFARPVPAGELVNLVRRLEAHGAPLAAV